MAYTLTDQFRPLRIALRINGIGVGLGVGLTLLLSSRLALSAWGLYESGLLWPYRLAGVALLTLGCFFMLISSQETIGLSFLLIVTLANILLALVLLSAYLQHEFSGLALGGQVLLILIFSLCLVGALSPLPYLRAEYRY